MIIEREFHKRLVIDRTFMANVTYLQDLRPLMELSA